MDGKMSFSEHVDVMVAKAFAVLILRIHFHRTNYGILEPMSSAMRQFNAVIGLFDFGLIRDQFLNLLRLTLTLLRFPESIVHCHAAVHYPFQLTICAVDVSIRRITSFS
jgi:hypothetical protein